MGRPADDPREGRTIDPIRDLADLVAAQRDRRPLDYVFFPDCGTVSDPPTASCLSQWGRSPFRSGGAWFHSAEQAMMHGKALLFGDHEMAARILGSRTAFQAKELGAQVRGFDEATWECRRIDVVVTANLAKFRALPGPCAYLLSTREAVLVEASPLDRIWGNGLDEFDRAARDPSRWPGLNLLGFALMEVRRILRSGASSPSP